MAYQTRSVSGHEPSSIVGVFEDIARRYPADIAVCFGRDRLTYAELKRRADNVANHLLAAGVVTGDMVGCCVERSLELVVTLLAILKAGGAYVPLDPDYPDDRLRFMIDDTACAVIVSSAESKAKLTAITTAKLLDATSSANTPSSSGSHPLPMPLPTSLAYVMYTSGSTGTPRGVLVEHRSIVRLVRETNYCTFTPTDVWLHFAPLAFDASTLEIWGPLLNGGRLVVAPPRASLADLGNLIRDERITSAWFTSGLFNLMVDQQLASMRSLRWLLAGGDVLSGKHVRAALEALPGCTVVNGYGPTENTTFTCCHQMRSAAEVQEPVPIGLPIGSTTVHVLGEDGKPVPDGTPGELFAGGLGVARGYLNRPEETARAFLPDPFDGTPDARMYRTGDIVKRSPDGVVHFIGRADNQVKILGHRIEIGEIEAVLAAHADVTNSCVTVNKFADGSKRLIAYYIARGDALSPNDLRTHMSERLPRYMMPALLVPMCAMPLTHNGKIDRAALPRPPEPSAGSPVAARVGASIEDMIKHAWQRSLGADQVGSDDNYFDIGGDSLRLVAMHADLQQMLGREIPILDLFEFTTPRALAAHLSGQSAPMRQVAAAQARGNQQRAAFQRLRSKAH